MFGSLNLVLIVFLICMQRYDTIQIQPFYEVDISLYRLNRKAVFFLLLIDNFTVFWFINPCVQSAKVNLPKYRTPPDGHSTNQILAVQSAKVNLPKYRTPRDGHWTNQMTVQLSINNIKKYNNIEMIIIYNKLSWFEYCNLIDRSAWWTFWLYLITWVGIVTSPTYSFANDKLK